jgi:uncharacterized protein (DUF302 family)
MPEPVDDIPQTGVVTRLSPRTVPETVACCLELLHARGITLFAVVDHSGAAESVGLTLRDTKVVVFGNPKGGTPVMEAVPLAALDLPLKILVWDDEGTTKVSYLDPHALSTRYDLPDDLSAPLAGIVGLVDALLNPTA